SKAAREAAGTRGAAARSCLSEDHRQFNVQETRTRTSLPAAPPNGRTLPLLVFFRCPLASPCSILRLRSGDVARLSTAAGATDQPLWPPPRHAAPEPDARRKGLRCMHLGH